MLSFVITSGLASDSDKFKIIITMRRAQKFRDSGPYKNFDFLYNRPKTILLGSPLFEGSCHNKTLSAKRAELSMITKRFDYETPRFMPSHDSLFLLRFVIAMPRLLYALRTAPCSGNPELCLYNNLIRETISITLNIDLNENRWNQASLPVRWRGRGIRSAVILAPSAYLALAAGTLDLTTRILPDWLNYRDSEDSYVKSAIYFFRWFGSYNHRAFESTIMGRRMLQIRV